MNQAVASTNVNISAPIIGSHALRATRDKRFDGDRPPRLGPVTVAEINAAINAIDDYLLPAPAAWIMARIATLQSYFFTAEMSEDLSVANARGWAKQLEEFPAWAINVACDAWTADQASKRPTPAAIRAHCHELTANSANRRVKLARVMRIHTHGADPVERVPPTDAEKAHVSMLVREMVEGFKREEGA